MNERRQSARLVDAVTFKIAYKDHDIICDTLNISTSGLLCRVNQHIPAMTKISMILVLANDQQPGGRNLEIQAKGVVVRSEKEQRGELYQLAIFFTDMSKAQREHLRAYIRSRLTEREFS